MIILAAMDEQNGIRNQHKLLARVEEDMFRFRSRTEGGVIAYDTDTLLTFPNQAPLPNRRNIVLSRTGEPIPGAEVYSDPQDFMDVLPNETYVVGGEKVYRMLIPYCKTALITRFLCTFPADAWFPYQFSSGAWTRAFVGKRMTDPKTGVRYRFEEYYNLWTNRL